MKFQVLAVSLALIACGQPAPTSPKKKVNSKVSSSTSGDDDKSEDQNGPTPSTSKSVSVVNGPVPEYGIDKVGIVISSSLIYDFAQAEFVSDLVKAGADKIFVANSKLGRNIEQETDPESSFSVFKQKIGQDFERLQFLTADNDFELSLWARDWSPIAFRKDSKLELADFQYFNTADIGALDDDVPALLGKAFGIPNATSGLKFEGGNFMANSRGDCLLSDSIVERNKENMDAEGIVSELKTVLGCKKVMLLPGIPHEGTGHIDIFAKFLNDDTIVVNEIQAKTLATISDADDRKKADEVRLSLDKVAEELSKASYKVVRIPMPAPLASKEHFPSYTNSLIVKGTIFVPKFQKRWADEKGEVENIEELSVDYADKSLLASYEKSVSEAYSAAGYKVMFHEMKLPDGTGVLDVLESLQGSIHCMTMQIPLN